MRNRLQQVLLSTYIRKHNTYPILVLLFAARRRRSSQGTHTLIKAPHARPSLSVATHDRQPFYDLVPRDPKRQVPLTNNEQIRVAPDESTSISGASRPLDLVSTFCRRFGLPVNHTWETGSSAGQGGPAKEQVLTGPGGL